MAKKAQPAWIKEGAGYVDIELSRPADFGGMSTKSLRMREPTVADAEVAAEVAGSDIAREVIVLANLCSQAPDDIRKLPMRDFFRIQEGYKLFID